MIALFGGFGAAACFTVSWLCASASSRQIGAAPTLAWVMLFGLALVAVPVALLAPLSQLSAKNLILLAILGAASLGGLRIQYVALRRGKVGVVSAIVSSEGVVAAAISVAAGAYLGLGTAVLLLTIGVGVALAAARPDRDAGAQVAVGMRAGLLALPVAALFGVSLYCTGRVGADVSVLWVVLPPRLLGTASIAAPLALRRRLRLTRRTFPLLAAAATSEVVGIMSYTVGARHGLAVAAVLTSQYAALATVAAFFIFRERLSRSQLAGLVVVGVGAALLALTRS
jgi:drug/metabolite transporter (DMT)-like permease